MARAGGYAARIGAQLLCEPSHDFSIARLTITKRLTSLL